MSALLWVIFLWALIDGGGSSGCGDACPRQDGGGDCPRDDNPYSNPLDYGMRQTDDWRQP